MCLLFHQSVENVYMFKIEVKKQTTEYKQLKGIFIFRHDYVIYQLQKII